MVQHISCNISNSKPLHCDGDPNLRSDHFSVPTCWRLDLGHRFVTEAQHDKGVKHAAIKVVWLHSFELEGVRRSALSTAGVTGQAERTWQIERHDCCERASVLLGSRRALSLIEVLGIWVETT